MPSYSPALLRGAVLRKAAPSEPNDNGSTGDSRRDIEAERKKLIDLQYKQAEQEFAEASAKARAKNPELDALRARREFSAVSPEYRVAQEELGLDPNRDLELLSRTDSSLGSNIRAGIEDAGMGLASIGAGLAAMVPSPIQKKAASQKELIDARRKLLRDFLENKSEGVNPGRGISKGAGFLTNFVNPAGKSTAANALYHGAVALGETGSAGKGFTAGASNVLGEAAESAASRAIQSRFPGIAAFIANNPQLKRFAGFPGNAAGMGIEELAGILEDAVADGKKK